MPHKPVDKILELPSWVDTIQDPCLEEVVTEALVARRAAVRSGAEEHEGCRRELVAADTTLDQVAYGRVKGRVAWRKAATALRKYNTASECAHPTARRGR